MSMSAPEEACPDRNHVRTMDTLVSQLRDHWLQKNFEGVLQAVRDGVDVAAFLRCAGDLWFRNDPEPDELKIGRRKDIGAVEFSLQDEDFAVSVWGIFFDRGLSVDANLLSDDVWGVFLAPVSGGTEAITLLHVAASYAKPKLVKLLLDRGATVNIVDCGFTPFDELLTCHSAVDDAASVIIEGRDEDQMRSDVVTCAKLLLEAGSDPNRIAHMDNCPKKLDGPIDPDADSASEAQGANEAAEEIGGSRMEEMVGGVLDVGQAERSEGEASGSGVSLLSDSLRSETNDSDEDEYHKGTALARIFNNSDSDDFSYFSGVCLLLVRHGGRFNTTAPISQLLEQHRGDRDAIEALTFLFRQDISQSDTLQHFRDDYDDLLQLLSLGATGTILDGRNLQEIADDAQNVHTNLVNNILRKHISEARTKIGRPGPELVPEGIWLEHLGALDGTTLGRIQGDVPNARNASPDEVRASIRSSVRRFYRDLNDVPSGILRSGPEAISLVYRRLVLVEGLDLDDVRVIMFQAFLKAANEYSWGGPSCAPGSISFVLQLLEGRVELSDDAEVVDDLPNDVDTYLELLKRTRDESHDFDAIQAEAISRLAAQPQVCSPNQINRLWVRMASALGSDVPQISLADVVDALSDADQFGWAVTSLRGLFFQSLAAEFGHLLAKFHIRDEEDGWVDMLPGLQDLLHCLAELAAVYTAAVTNPPELIPKLLFPLVEDADREPKRRRTDGAFGDGPGA